MIEIAIPLPWTFISVGSTHVLSGISHHLGFLSLMSHKYPNLLATTGTMAGELEGEAYTKALGLALTLTIVVLYLSAQVLGELAVRIGLPAVLGELIAGLAIGLSGLHAIALGGDAHVASWMTATIQSLTGGSDRAIAEIFSGPVEIVLEDYAQFGVGILLFKIGLEADLKELIRVGPQAASVAIAGVTLPFVLGYLGLSTLFHLDNIPALFGAAALTATSIGITSRIMQDMGVLNTREGQIILGAAVLDDILGIAVLAVAVGIAEHGTVELGDVLTTVLSAVIFVAAAIVLNRFFGPAYMDFLKNLGNPYSVFIGAILFLTFMAAFAAIIGLESILGCFAAGIVLGDTPVTKELEEACTPLVALFSTVFFVTIGAKTDLTAINLADPESRVGLTIALFLTVLAILTKMMAGYFVFTKDKVDRFAIGAGMVPRGEVGLVFAGLGAATGALSASVNVAIILMVIGTTFAAPPLLRWAFSRQAIVTT